MSKARKKPTRPKATIPRGLRDSFGAEIRARRSMLEKICAIYELYGFDQLETPAFEFVSCLGKFLPDVEQPMGGVFGFRDDDEQWLALRYDLTAPLARVAAQYQHDLPTPFRRYAVGPVWRNEKPGPGRYREFWQCDADSVGVSDIGADAEMCMMLADALEAAGISRGDYVVRVNSRNILTGVLDAIGLPEDAEGTEAHKQRLVVFRAIDKLDRLGLEAVRALLGPGRKDESGDFTEGAHLADEQIEQLLSLLQCSGDDLDKLFAHMRSLIGNSEFGEKGIAELTHIAELTQKAGYDSSRICIDPSIVRGLDYYTGPVFEAELTFEIRDDKGQLRRFGSVAGGGRYDELVKRFTGQAAPATGISIGVDRLLAALAAVSDGASAKSTPNARNDGPVIILRMDKDRTADYQLLCAELRQAGIRTELYLGGGNMGKQMKYADKRHAPYVIIEGEDEHTKGEVQIKDLSLGASLAKTIDSHEEWRSRPAQFSVPRGEIVQRMTELVRRQNEH